MNKNLLFITTFLLLCCLFSCHGDPRYWDNKVFDLALGKYYGYADKVGFGSVLEYIRIDAEEAGDSTVFSIYLDGGASPFLNETNRIRGFFRYKKYDLLLSGDYPNRIVHFERHQNLNLLENVVKVRYPDAYKKYLKDKSPVAPIMSDNMGMTLVFKKNRLVRCTRNPF